MENEFEGRRRKNYLRCSAKISTRELRSGPQCSWQLFLQPGPEVGFLKYKEKICYKNMSLISVNNAYVVVEMYMSHTYSYIAS